MAARLTQGWVTESRVPRALHGQGLCQWFAQRVRTLEGASVLLLWHQALVLSAARPALWREFANEAGSADEEMGLGLVDRIQAMEAEAAECLAEMSGCRLMPAVIAELAAWIERPLQTPWEVVLRAMGLARAIDARWGTELPTLFQAATGSTAPLRLRGGWPVPRAEPPLRAMMRGRPLSTRPDSLELCNLPQTHTDRLGLLRRRENAPGIRLHLADAGTPPWAETPLRVAVLVLRDAVGHSVQAMASSGGRFRVRVRGAAAAVAERLAADVRTAADDGAAVLVMPELCSAREIHVRLDATIARRERAGAPPPRLMVTGSRHVTTRGSGDKRRLRNRATLYVDGHAVLEHDKFNPVMISPQKQEAIDTRRPTLSLYWHPSFSVAVAICKDLLHPGARDRLADASPTFVLVPAWTPKAQPFELVAAALLLQQSITVVCNHVDEDADCDATPAAVMALPVRDDGHLIPLRGRSVVQGVWGCLTEGQRWERINR